MKWKRKPDIIEAVQWWKLGDWEAGSHADAALHVGQWEGWGDYGDYDCDTCHQPMAKHGSIMTGIGKKPVCPGDWIEVDVHPGIYSRWTTSHLMSNYEPVEEKGEGNVDNNL